MSAFIYFRIKNCFKINRTFHTKRLNLCYNSSQFFDQKGIKMTIQSIPLLPQSILKKN